MDVEKYIRESNKIEGVHSEDAVETSLDAWNYLKQQDELSHEVVKELHRKILKERQPGIAGKYRHIQVYVGEHVPPPPEKVEELMDEWLSKEHPSTEEEVIRRHVEFEKIHPFADGNGRTGRILAWRQSLRIGVEPPLWTAENRQEYYKLFRQ